ncbi:MAG: hypothetical protein ACOYKZ_06765 [Chlamydiia bacterium]
MGLGSYGTSPSVSGGALASPAMMGMTMEQVKLWIVSQIITNMQQSVAEASNIFLPPSHQDDPSWARQPPPSWDQSSQPKAPPAREASPASPHPAAPSATKTPDGRPVPAHTSAGPPAAPSRPQDPGQAPRQPLPTSASPGTASASTQESSGQTGAPATKAQVPLPGFFARIVSASQDAGHAATTMLPKGTQLAPASSPLLRSETGEGSPSVAVPSKETQFSHGASTSHPLSGPKWPATLSGWMQGTPGTPAAHPSQQPMTNAPLQGTTRQEHSTSSYSPPGSNDRASSPHETKWSGTARTAPDTHPSEHPRQLAATTVHPREQMPTRAPRNNADQSMGTTRHPADQDREHAATIPMSMPNHLPNSERPGIGPGQTPLPTKAAEQEFSSTPGWAGQTSPSRSEERPPLGAMGMPTWAQQNPHQPQKSEGFRAPPAPQGGGTMSGNGQAISLGALQQSGQAASSRQQAAQSEPRGGSGGTSVVWLFWTVSLTLVGFCGGALWWLIHSV